MKPNTCGRLMINSLGQGVIRFFEQVHELGAFALITIGVTFTKLNKSKRLIHPLIRKHIFQSGVQLMPVTCFLAFVIGFIVVGQTIAQLSRVGAQNYAGTVMVAVVVRELGPIVATLLVLARIGTSTVIELGTSRAMGEIEALEALGIDSIHYLVMPRVISLALAVFALTVYLLILTMFSGYLFVFAQNVQLQPWTYFDQIAAALRWDDFLILGLKTVFFGLGIGVISCYEGLAKPLRLEEVSKATNRAVGKTVALCAIIDAIFIIYLIV
ncbi:MAG: ABC transporter permease [Verrucomicrobia bacterium]|nr:ABC transporter permease [Verrucomicrobiota bacterium]MCF7707565.1 ABC transporter permease [Verrucomicrobiota bacterium]